MLRNEPLNILKITFYYIFFINGFKIASKLTMVSEEKVFESVIRNLIKLRKSVITPVCLCFP